MPDDWPTRFTQEALAKVDAFIAAHPGYSRHGVEQPGQGATNRVIFGRRGEDEIVVLKVFCETERKARACFAFCHWRETGLVPELIHDVDDSTIVMSYVPGYFLFQSRESEGHAVWRQACYQAGRAVAALTRVPLEATDRAAFEARFYDRLGPLDAYLGRVLELGRRINACDPDFGGDFWRKSLDLIEAELPSILGQPRVLYHQDVSNLHVRQGRFMGFFDLEMCRAGCAAMQLASALGMLERERAGWQRFRAGWEATAGSPLGPGDLQAVAAASHLLHWREISRYMSYDGTPGSGYAWASPADPARYRRSLEAMARMIGAKG
jgi:hypothetical protein